MNSIFLSPTCFVFATLASVVSVAAAALRNMTLTLPEGSSNHGDPNLLCTPTRWTDLASFYLFNYVAHATTVLIRPGEQPFSFAVTVVGCLLFPTMGAFRGIEALMCGAVLVKSELEKAARSGALCMLVRSPDWEPEAGDAVPNGVVKFGQDSKEKGVPVVEMQIYQPPWSHCNARGVIGASSQLKHGAFKVPTGYHWVVVPGNATFAEDEDAATSLISSGYSSIKVLVALAQTAYAITTLYRSRGDQVKRYGYAAFGLTVAPYAVMSVVNLLGNLCRPDYAALYVVESSIMDEARRRPGAYFSGSVGRLAEGGHATVRSCTETPRDLESIQGPLEFSRGTHDQILVNFHLASARGSTDATACERAVYELQDTSKEMTRGFAPRSFPNQAQVCRDTRLSHERQSMGPVKNDIVLLPSCNPLRLTGNPAGPEPYTVTQASLRTKRLDSFDAKKKIERWEVRFEGMGLSNPTHRRSRNLTYAFTLSLGMISVAINGAMSHFQAGASTPVQQSWTMVWLAFGVVSGFAFIVSTEQERGTERWQRHTGPWWAPCWQLLSYMGSASPAIGGLLVVGQMIHEYGSCTRIT